MKTQAAHLIFKSASFKIIMFAVMLLLSIPEASAQETGGDVSLFDGATLKGWRAVPDKYMKHWSVIDGVLTGGDGVQKIPTNLFLYTEKSYEDFEFRCLFKLTGDPDKGMINSGIQYRSVIEGEKMVGYQADIGNGYWGDIYDEHRRGELVKGELSVLKEILNDEGWNSYIIRCQGNKHKIYINGVKTAEYEEKNKEIPSKGVIAIQLHSGGNAKIEMKHITISML